MAVQSKGCSISKGFINSVPTFIHCQFFDQKILPEFKYRIFYGSSYIFLYKKLQWMDVGPELKNCFQVCYVKVCVDKLENSLRIIPFQRCILRYIIDLVYQHFYSGQLLLFHIIQVHEKLTFSTLNSRFFSETFDS